jgi:peptidoglycan/LPS O-acetylase OafA/YrhL
VAVRKPHIRELDLVRALTVMGVISVHTTWFTTVGTSFWPAFAMDALHYTREVFLFMTAFVLFYTYYDRKISLGSWWLRRFKLVGIPYVVWSAAYLVYGGHLADGVLPYLKTLGIDLLTGVAWFHLYYLLVTLQIYLVFPLLVWVVRQFEGRHHWLLLISFLAEAGMMAVFQYDGGIARTPGLIGVLWGYRGQFFFTYQFYLFLGAVASIHLDTLRRLLRERVAWVVSGLALSLAGMWALYIWSVDSHYMVPFQAYSVLQPMMVPYALFIILAGYALGMGWDRHFERYGKISALVLLAAELSFGVYLLHPMILQELTTYVTPLFSAVPRLIVTPLTMLAVYALSLVVVRLLAATPASVYVIGRNQMPIRWGTDWTWLRLRNRADIKDLKEAQ